MTFAGFSTLRNRFHLGLTNKNGDKDETSNENDVLKEKMELFARIIFLMVMIAISLSKRITLQHKNLLYSDDFVKKRQGLSVGTVPGVSNAAFNGTARDSFEYAARPGETSTTFFVYMDYAEVGEEEVEIEKAKD